MVRPIDPVPGREPSSLGDAFLEALAQRIAADVVRQVAPLLNRLLIPKVSYTVQEAAEATGVSDRTIRRAIQSGHLIAIYPTTRPLIPAEELREWLASMPSEGPT